MNNSVKKATNILQEGGVVIFPTDTVYGIGCRLDNEEAIKRIYKIRNRSQEKAVLAVVDSIAMAEKYLLPIPPEVRSKLLKKYWPGGLTVILPCKVDIVPSAARAGGSTLAVRQTNHPVLLKIIKAVGVPLIAPSANFSGGITPTSSEELDPKFAALSDFVLKGECGGNKPSTIIDCSITPWKIVREGAVNVQF
ncbi:MAG: threonylcarbamoyl-AMP synthase [Patescibacteria group bacterium]|nr:threonylcarbamoyl-AMP synthase [Patescibacteria group bacterium]MDE2589178.1 threonylcarbamoyl-AMP synthase [Patescibacteria group bacterium]